MIEGAASTLALPCKTAGLGMEERTVHVLAVGVDKQALVAKLTAGEGFALGSRVMIGTLISSFAHRPELAAFHSFLPLHRNRILFHHLHVFLVHVCFIVRVAE